MKDLKVDNEELNALADELERLNENIIKIFIKELRDKDEDIFQRYITFVHAGNLVHIAKSILKFSDQTFKSGFKVQDKIFQTNFAIKKGWDDPKTAHHPFFIQNEDEENG